MLKMPRVLFSFQLLFFTFSTWATFSLLLQTKDDYSRILSFKKMDTSSIGQDQKALLLYFTRLHVTVKFWVQMMQTGIEAINILRSAADRIKSPISWSRTIVIKLVSEVPKKDVNQSPFKYFSNRSRLSFYSVMYI